MTVFLQKCRTLAVFDQFTHKSQTCSFESRNGCLCNSGTSFNIHNGIDLLAESQSLLGAYWGAAVFVVLSIGPQVGLAAHQNNWDIWGHRPHFGAPVVQSVEKR